ncbi:type IV pilus twitching motility protein PilT [Candidatus Aminicenantes bacterium AC-335-A11]|jgi:twitching motility protein PilT|nr:type IV pilus twitching motility protein PilT [SCandidatus Aminicenantes bacterium Aminicenantia_JdfR_composite]MCP2597684.1 type IV pilus twitching motility protein PilT [Candidatus Aminicenantes bacterium AC-335-G13]MCP2598014.1 type IV pilus twitching motility protein PilT [Candidatus Aminicenantes bacterium AC-335-L06]MCP2606159.1 type IV pilus twitching motility protein PilT [Candidatus Aminicenantes bacterium AC-708-I09]MCP2618802.1 type IV pilus twitching motility protein PilT [Candid
MTIKDLLKIAIEKNASDLHLKVGNHPIIRVDGKLVPLTNLRRLTQEDTVRMANEIMNEYQKKKLQEQFDVDLAYSVPGFGRFRGNVFYQRGSIGIVMRIIPLKVKTIRELLLPTVLEKISMEKRGLVLVTGTTGSGKSTTLAAMIDYINTHRAEHIITIEDPIEFVHRDKKSIVNQREVGLDVANFSRGLISALREDPDVIFVGEMRDFETIHTAILAAETGHLVLSTLHTLDAPETINRIISVYPPHQHKQVRLQLASLLKAVISMRLLPRADVPGRVPAVEVMINTPFIRECIINKEKTHLIRDAIAAGVSQYGMQTFDQSLYKLYINKYIDYETALQYASNPDNFRLKVMGIQSTSDIALEEMERTMSKIGEEAEEEGPEEFE